MVSFPITGSECLLDEESDPVEPNTQSHLGRGKQKWTKTRFHDNLSSKQDAEHNSDLHKSQIFPSSFASTTGDSDMMEIMPDPNDDNDSPDDDDQESVDLSDWMDDSVSDADSYFMPPPPLNKPLFTMTE